MFPVRSLVLTIALSLVGSVPCVGCSDVQPPAPKVAATIAAQPVGSEIMIDGRPWVMTIDGLEPVSAN